MHSVHSLLKKAFRATLSEVASPPFQTSHKKTQSPFRLSPLDLCSLGLSSGPAAPPPPTRHSVRSSALEEGLAFRRHEELSDRQPGAGEVPSGAAHRGVGVAVLAAADVDLVLRGLLVHGVVEVDAVDALQPPILPEEEGSEGQEDEQCCGERGGVPPSDARPFHGEMFLFPIYYLYFSNLPNTWDFSGGPAVKTHCRGSGFQP